MGHDHVRAFDGKTRLPDVARVEEVLEEVGLAELVEDPDFSSAERRTRLRVGSIRSWSQSRSPGSWRCMYSTPTERQYVSRSADRISLRPASPRNSVSGVKKPPLQVGFGQAEGGRVQQRVAVRALCQRIEAGQQVPISR